jgi:predicted RNase H-like HicB family nuclease
LPRAPGVSGFRYGKIAVMKRPFAATVWREGNVYIGQCLEVDVASQGATEEEALTNLTEALELHFEPPRPTRPPKVRTIEVEVGAA